MAIRQLRRCQRHGLLFTTVHGSDRQGPRRAVRARLSPTCKRAGPAGALTCHGPFHRPHQDHQNQAQSASQRRLGVADLAPATWLPARRAT